MNLRLLPILCLLAACQPTPTDEAVQTDETPQADEAAQAGEAAQTAATQTAPLGCWDWWGYTGEDYATKQGAQVTAVRSLIDTLMQ